MLLVTPGMTDQNVCCGKKKPENITTVSDYALIGFANEWTLHQQYSLKLHLIRHLHKCPGVK